MYKTALILLVFSLASLQASACSCIGYKESEKKSVQRFFDKSEVIFVGNLVKTEILNKSDRWSSAEPVKYTFKVIEHLKGDDSKKIVSVITARSDASCGYNFKIGLTYLVHSNNRKDFPERYPDFFTSKTVLTSGSCYGNLNRRSVSKKRMKYYRKQRKEFLRS